MRRRASCASISAALPVLPMSQPSRPRHPLEAEITSAINLNGSGSSSETWHIELATDAAGYAYEPGDAIGVIAENDAGLAAELATVVGLGGDAELVRKLVDELRHHDADAAPGGSLRPANRPHRCGAARRRREASSVRRRPADHRSVLDFTEKLTADQLQGLVAPVALAPVLGCLESQGASGRDASARLGRSLALAWARPHGRRFDLAGRSAQGRRERKDLCEAEPALQTAQRPRQAHHHDWRRHRRSALPRLRRGARGDRASPRRAGCSSARATTPTTSCISSNGRIT